MQSIFLDVYNDSNKETWITQGSQEQGAISGSQMMDSISVCQMALRPGFWHPPLYMSFTHNANWAALHKKGKGGGLVIPLLLFFMMKPRIAAWVAKFVKSVRVCNIFSCLQIDVLLLWVMDIYKHVSLNTSGTIILLGNFSFYIIFIKIRQIKLIQSMQDKMYKNNLKRKFSAEKEGKNLSPSS